MVMAARLSLSSTPPNALPLNTLSHGDTEPRTAPIQLWGGEAKEERSLEDSQKPWIDPPAKKKPVGERLVKTVNFRRNKWGTYSVDADGIRKWHPVSETLFESLTKELGRGRGSNLGAGRGNGRACGIAFKNPLGNEEVTTALENNEETEDRGHDEPI
jgi:hypothetical protein